MDIDPFVAFLVICLAALFIGTIWFLASTLGAFIPVSIWLIIIGALGIGALLVFLKITQD